MGAPIPFHGDTRSHLPTITKVGLLCASLACRDEKEAYEEHKSALGNMRFPIPSSKQNASGMEHANFIELLRVGSDTRAPAALFWWSQGEAVNFRGLFHVEAEEDSSRS